VGFGTFVKLQLSHEISVGSAFFDIEPQFPCSALFLDSQNCLILKPHGEGSNTFSRIGIGRFMRTPLQMSLEPLYDKATNRHYQVPCGPITKNDACTIVTIS